MELLDAAAAPCYRISPGDTVKLVVVREPAGDDDPSVCFEVWEPGGAQPLNQHPRSTETFWFLHGEGVAESDGVRCPVHAGELLVLPPGSRHRIINTGRGRLYAVTTMSPDDGFVALIRRGVRDALDDADRAVLRGLRGRW
jgi:mannose-6-phosphate isomerase-like protein (cupin superfamily)